MPALIGSGSDGGGETEPAVLLPGAPACASCDAPRLRHHSELSKVSNPGALLLRRKNHSPDLVYGASEIDEWSDWWRLCGFVPGLNQLVPTTGTRAVTLLFMNWDLLRCARRPVTHCVWDQAVWLIGRTPHRACEDEEVPGGLPCLIHKTSSSTSFSEMNNRCKWNLNKG